MSKFVVQLPSSATSGLQRSLPLACAVDHADAFTVTAALVRVNGSTAREPFLTQYRTSEVYQVFGVTWAGIELTACATNYTVWSVVQSFSRSS